ncbi:MAG: hypothetical protein IJI60_05165 [Bacilli bacterium]|nr:hypothetical protein [Bacilli bacterium]
MAKKNLKTNEIQDRFQEANLSNPFLHHQIGRSSKLPFGLAFLGILVVGLILFLAGILCMLYLHSKRLVCKSEYSSITIIYDKVGLIGYSSKKYSYDFFQEQKSAKKMGVQKYIKAFQDSFQSSTGGSCKTVKE